MWQKVKLYYIVLKLVFLPQQKFFEKDFVFERHVCSIFLVELNSYIHLVEKGGNREENLYLCYLMGTYYFPFFLCFEASLVRSIWTIRRVWDNAIFSFSIFWQMTNSQRMTETFCSAARFGQKVLAGKGQLPNAFLMAGSGP